MPSPGEILAQLTRIAQENMHWAIVWHVAVAMGVVAVISGWRPRDSLAGRLLALAAASVSGFAFRYGNVFNGVVFASLFVAMLVGARRLGSARVEARTGWSRVAGGVMVGFAWVYPHFLPVGSSTVYLVAAPMGLLPCPTLSLLIGLTLIGAGARSRLWMGLLTAFGLFYGVFGLVRLGVAIDGVLVVGALALLPHLRLRETGLAHAAST